MLDNTIRVHSHNVLQTTNAHFLREGEKRERDDLATKRQL